MNWIELDKIGQLSDIRQLSQARPQLIFKHSTRCFISSMIKDRLERTVPPNEIDFYMLDIIRCRQISNMIAYEFSVHHESPQILLIKNGDCVYDESHNDINMNAIASQMK